MDNLVLVLGVFKGDCSTEKNERLHVCYKDKDGFYAYSGEIINVKKWRYMNENDLRFINE